MLKKFLFTALASGTLAVAALGADVVVRVAPPRPVVETRPPAPGRDYVWTPGYHRWDGSRYAWVGGAWAVPPRRHAHWVPAHWAHKRGGWVFVEGRWR